MAIIICNNIIIILIRSSRYQQGKTIIPTGCLSPLHLTISPSVPFWNKRTLEILCVLFYLMNEMTLHHLHLWLSLVLARFSFQWIRPFFMDKFPSCFPLCMMPLNKLPGDGRLSHIVISEANHVVPYLLSGSFTGPQCQDPGNQWKLPMPIAWVGIDC